MTNPIHRLEGVVGEPFTMPLELGKVREFAKAVSIDPVRVSISDGDFVPATFLQTALLWDHPGTNPFYDSGLDFQRLLHGEQRFDYVQGPPRVGQRLTVTRKIESVADKVGRRSGMMTFVVEATEFRDEADTLVATSTNTRIITGEAARPIDADSSAQIDGSSNDMKDGRR